MKTTLTIAIPTYNRVDKLKECLSKVLSQAQGKSVELLVSDNASTDKTEAFMRSFCAEHPEAFMRSFCAEHPEVTYIRNAENIGPDRNFLNCYNHAGSTYTLLLGDDDMLLPGAVDHILRVLERQPVFVHLNTSNLICAEPLEYTPPRIPEGEDRVYRSRDALMQDMGVFVTFLSSFIVRTDLVRAIPNKEQYIGTYFIQSHIALKTLAADGEYVFITKNCLAATGNLTVNYDVYFVWGQMYGQLLNKTAVEAGMDPAMIKQLYKRDLETVIYGFAKNLRLSCPDSKNWKKACMLAQVRQYPLLYLRYLVIMYLPVSFIKAVTNASQAVKRLLGK